MNRVLGATVVWALASTWTPAAFAQLEEKDPNPPSISGASGVPLGPCGSDIGYVCDPTVPFAGVDISGTGAVVVTGDDSSSGPIPLGGPGFVTVYGTDYAALVMASNGYISTSPIDTGPDLSNDCPLPAPPSTGGGDRLYPLHDDLDLEAGIGQGLYEYFFPCPRQSDTGITEGCHVFMWDDVAHFPGSASAPTWDQWVYAYDSGDFTFEVGPGNPELGSGSTTGIQNAGATEGVTVACDTAGSIPDNFAVTLFVNRADVPAVDGWVLALFGGLLLLLGALKLRRKRSVAC